MSTAFLTLWIGHRFLHIPAGMLIGMLAGLQTQPAVLAFANEQAGNEMPGLGFVTVNPVAQVSKILFAQVLIVFLA
jgi:putative transport protein